MKNEDERINSHREMNYIERRRGRIQYSTPGPLFGTCMPRLSNTSSGRAPTSLIGKPFGKNVISVAASCMFSRQMYQESYRLGSMTDL